MREAVLLVSHGTVERLDDLPAFLTNIRRGHAAPLEMVAEVRRRYEAIGGKSPLNAISRSTADKLEKKLGVPVRYAGRLWEPKPADVLARLADEGVARVLVLPLAQHSAHVYGAAVERAYAGKMEIVCAPNWGSEPLLALAYAAAIEQVRGDEHAIVMTAHSLPLAVVRAGDPYEKEVRASADAIAAKLSRAARYEIAFQSRGMDGGEWLGPDLETVVRDLARRGEAAVLVAPIGFLADHVEILYDLDIEARALAESIGMKYVRAPSLNDSDALVEALATVAKRSLSSC
jgi:ferrochelatase